MQEPSLKLKEIIWEITGECHNGCTYCGSKEVWKNKTDEETILKIVEEIALYPPEQIDISGGDPMCVSFAVHQKIVNLLKEKNVVCKILVNPKSLVTDLDVYSLQLHTKTIFGKKEVRDEQMLKVNLYDWVGISVNTEEEFEIVENLVKSVLDRFTVVTNFNTSNLYMFDVIQEFVKQHNLQWQIQLTMTDSKVMAIYKNPKALKTLLEKIQEAYDSGVKIIPADNINNGHCGAGSQSLGILSNGDVVPCLSMRSWNKELPNLSQGNILIGGLTNIWETKFQDYRYKCFSCCKDDCGNIDFWFKENSMNKLLKQAKESLKPKEEKGQVINFPRVERLPRSFPPRTMLYGVPVDFPEFPSPETGIMAYAVFNDGSFDSISSITSNSTTSIPTPPKPPESKFLKEGEEPEK